MRETNVLLAIDEAAFQDELLHYLDRLPSVRVVGAVDAEQRLPSAIRELGPDAVIAVPGLLPRAPHLTTMAVALKETTEGLRKAIRAGANAFFVWPEERQALAREVIRVRKDDAAAVSERGRVVAVLGARGGAGATFLATNLAGALGRAGTKTVLADLDTVFGDVAAALGIPPDSELPTIADLAHVSREVTDEHLDRVLHDSAAGFQVLLAPPEPLERGALEATSIRGVVEALRARFGAAILHLPRGLDDWVRRAIELADDVLLVVTPDVLGIRSAKRVADALRALGLGERLRLVVNRAGRGEVVPEDAGRVLDLPFAGVLRSERSVERAQNRGQLIVGRRGRLSRRIARLADELLERSSA